MSELHVEKRPGYDWIVVFRNPDDSDIVVATIFGVMSLRLVTEQAYDDAGELNDYDIIAIIRQDLANTVGKEVY